MDINKRNFLLNAFKLGGAAAIYKMLPIREADAFMQMRGQAVASGTPTYSLEETFNWTAASNEAVGNTSGNTNKAGRHTAAGSYTIKKIEVRVTESGSPTQTITAYLYTSTGDPYNTPDTLTDTSNETLDASTLSGITEVAFTFGTGLTVSNGTRFWVRLGASAVDGSNYIVWKQESGDRVCYSSDGSSWSYEGTHSVSLKTYSED